MTAGAAPLESQKFAPPADFSAEAHIKSLAEYEALYHRSIEDPEGFWGEIADGFHFFKKWDKVLEWKLPDAKWFVGGQLNMSYNCLDVQIQKGRGNHLAILWEGEPVDETGEPTEIRKLSYNDLLREVCKYANGLKKLGDSFYSTSSMTSCRAPGSARYTKTPTSSTIGPGFSSILCLRRALRSFVAG